MHDPTSEQSLVPVIEAGQTVKCRFAEKGCKDPAILIAYIPQGCICWPDPVQALCAQHYITAESTGPVSMIAGLKEEEP